MVSVLLHTNFPSHACVKLIELLIVLLRGVDMAEYLVSDPAIQDAHPHTQYDLIANICHEGEPGKGKLVYFRLTNFVFTLVCKIIIQVLRQKILDNFTVKTGQAFLSRVD